MAPPPSKLRSPAAFRLALERDANALPYVDSPWSASEIAWGLAATANPYRDLAGAYLATMSEKERQQTLILDIAARVRAAFPRDPAELPFALLGRLLEIRDGAANPCSPALELFVEEVWSFYRNTVIPDGVEVKVAEAIDFLQSLVDEEVDAALEAKASVSVKNGYVRESSLDAFMRRSRALEQGIRLRASYEWLVPWTYVTSVRKHAAGKKRIHKRSPLNPSRKTLEGRFGKLGEVVYDLWPAFHVYAEVQMITLACAVSKTVGSERVEDFVDWFADVLWEDAFSAHVTAAQLPDVGPVLPEERASRLSALKRFEQLFKELRDAPRKDRRVKRMLELMDHQGHIEFAKQVTFLWRWKETPARTYLPILSPGLRARYFKKAAHRTATHIYARTSKDVPYSTYNKHFAKLTAKRGIKPNPFELRDSVDRAKAMRAHHDPFGTLQTIEEMARLKSIPTTTLRRALREEAKTSPPPRENGKYYRLNEDWQQRVLRRVPTRAFVRAALLCKHSKSEADVLLRVIPREVLQGHGPPSEEQWSKIETATGVSLRQKG